MNALTTGICDALQRLRACRETINGVFVTTDCLYPGNSTVTVSVRGAGATYRVSDDGAALHEAMAAGAADAKANAVETRAILAQGLEINQGAITSPEITLSAVPAAILLVANASKELADAIFLRWRLPRKGDFRRLVRDLLQAEFTSTRVISETFIGRSNKRHKFENVVRLRSGKRLALEPVLNDPNSINSRVVASLDVSACGYEDLLQRLVYDDRESWRAEDLSVLQVSGAPVVPYTKSRDVIRELQEA